MQNEYILLLMALGWILLMLGFVGLILWIATSIRGKSQRNNESMMFKSKKQ
jgi:hypothetical protein